MRPVAMPVRSQKPGLFVSTLLALGGGTLLACALWPTIGVADEVTGAVVVAAGGGPRSDSLDLLDLLYFESRLVGSPRIAAAESEREAQEQVARRLAAENGLKLFGGASLGSASEPTGPDTGRWNYQSASAYIGLLYPLLGSQVREQADITAAQGAARRLLLRSEQARREELRELRRSYIRHWGATRSARITAAFLATEKPVTEFLSRRQQAGLLTEAARLEFLQAYAAVRRDRAHSTASRQAALATLNRIAGTNLVAFEPALPALPPCADDWDAVAEVVLAHPDLEGLRVAISAAEKSLGQSAGRYPESSLRLTLGVTQDWPGGEGHSGVLSLEFRMPLGVWSAHEASKAQARSELRQRQQELDHRTLALQAQARESFELLRARVEDLAFARQALATAQETLYAGCMRAAALDGDALDAVLRARYAYYRAALDVVAAEVDLVSAQADLLALTGEPAEGRVVVPETPINLRLLGMELLGALGRADDPLELRKQLESTFAPVAGSAVAPPVPPALSRGVYMWDSESWLAVQDYDNDPVHAALEDHGIRFVFLSLNAAQIRAVKSQPEFRQHLARLLRAAQERGLRVQLLLGDPHWILPEGRGSLLDIIATLRDLPFDGLHLDLEPEQLQLAPGEMPRLLAELVNTGRVARAATLWPVSLSLHPRHLNALVGTDTLGAVLARLGVAEVTVMIYIANAQRVVDVARPLLQSHSSLRFRIALSVEPPPVATPEESFATAGMRALHEAMIVIEDALRRLPNYRGLVVQDWNALKGMSP